MFKLSYNTFYFSSASIIGHKIGKIERCFPSKMRIFATKIKQNYATRRDYTSNAYLE